MARRFLLAIVIAFLLCGCATTKTGRTFSNAEPPESNMGLLYVFRVSSFAGGWYVAQISLDGQPIGRVGSGEYFVRKITPGTHELKLEKSFLETGKEHRLIIEAKPGGIYYVQYLVEVSEAIIIGSAGYGLTRDDFLIVPEDRASFALRGLTEAQ